MTYFQLLDETTLYKTDNLLNAVRNQILSENTCQPWLFPQFLIIFPVVLQIQWFFEVNTFREITGSSI